VLQLNDAALSGLKTSNPAGIIAIEDLIPWGLAVEAASAYCQEFVPDIALEKLDLTPEHVFSVEPSPPPASPVDTLRGLEASIRQLSGSESFHLNKVGFARAVVKTVERRAASDPDLSVVADNFRLLFSELGKRQRAAVRAESAGRISSRINRTRDRFVRAHPTTVSREDVILLIEDISGQLDNSVEAEDVRADMRKWHSTYELDDDPRSEIAAYEGFITDLKGLAYVGMRNASVEPPSQN
jgi:hypothetical protein